MRLQIHGKRMSFSLGTGNAEAAARKAANLYTDFLTLGSRSRAWEASATESHAEYHYHRPMD